MAQSSSLSVETETLNHVLGLIEAFRAFDSDNDGRINAQELGGIMGSFGYDASEQDIRTMMQKRDSPEDEQLSLSEFLEMNTKDLELGCLSGLKTALEGLDLYGHDIVTGEQLYEVAENMGIELSLDDCLDIIASIDEDGDGAIALEDFRAMVNALV